jgi:hypothetical protein
VRQVLPWDHGTFDVVQGREFLDVVRQPGHRQLVHGPNTDQVVGRLGREHPVMVGGEGDAVAVLLGMT